MVKARGPVALFLLCTLAATAVACDLPRLEDQRERPLAQTTFLYTSTGSLITASA